MVSSSPPDGKIPRPDDHEWTDEEYETAYDGPAPGAPEAVYLPPPPPGTPMQPYYPNDESESWMKGRWPYVDADGDPVDTAGEMRRLYPTVNLRTLRRMPISRVMPVKLRGEIDSWGPDDDNLDGSWTA